MKKIILFLVLLITILSFIKITEAKTIPIEISNDLCTGVSEALPAPQGNCPINSNTNIVFYGQTTGGVGTLSKSWIIHFLDWWKTHALNGNSYNLIKKLNI